MCLEEVARRLDLTPAEVVRLHAGADHYVYFVGFTPGLPYMAGQPARLTIPARPPANQDAARQRRDRRHADLHLLGGEPGRLLAPRPDAAPALRPRRPDPILRAGDHVRFQPIEPAEYDTIAAAVAAGGYRPRSRRPGRPLRRRRGPPGRRSRTSAASPARRRPALGAHGPRRVIANRLVGNPDGAAGLECTIKGPRLEVRQAAVVAVAGAPMGFTVNGQEAPAWTAVRVRPGDVLGSRWRAPAAAPTWRWRAASTSRRCWARARPTCAAGSAASAAGAPEGRRAAPRDGRPARNGRADALDRATAAYPAERGCRVILGPQDDRFTPEGIRRSSRAPTTSPRRPTGWGIV